MKALNRMKKILSVLGLVALSVGALSCAPRKLDSLIMDEQVTYDKFQLGNVMFSDAVMDAGALKARRESPNSDAGALIAKDDLSDIDARRSAEIMIATMKDDREGIKTELAVTHPRMTPEMAKTLLESMKAGREIPAELMTKFSETFLEFPRPYRYLGQLRIEGERLSKEHKEYSETKDEDTNRKDAKGMPIKIKVPYVVNEFISHRELDLRLLIFDMKQKKVIFDGVAIERTSNSNRNERRQGTFSFGSVLSGSANSFPDFPERLGLVTSGAKRFIGAIPKS